MSGKPPGRQRTLVFSGFRLDRDAQQLSHDGTVVPLRPRTWEVLSHLADRPGVLVTKQELHEAVWRGVAVTEDTLTQSILELRRAFGDDARKPRFIETVHARGFRFIAQPRAADVRAATPTRGVVGPFVGRDAELARLRSSLRRAERGQRQIAFITGEAGIGKSRLVEELVWSPALRRMGAVVLSGQCIERHAGREAYAPVFEALERLLGSQDGRNLLAPFARLAPTWMAQMPALGADASPATFPPPPTSDPPARMLREGTAALEAMASERTVVLVLEDLHWGDPATIDLVSALGERSDPVRLLVIATYRPAEASVAENPIRVVRQTLRVRRRGLDLALDYLTESSVREYLRRRFGDGARPLAALIHAHTDGNPLFVIQVADELVRRGAIARHGRRWVVSSSIGRRDLALSDDVRDLIALDLRHLTADERQIVETGAIAGGTFAPEIVAAALGRDPEEVAVACDRLASVRLFLEPVVRPRWPGDPVAPQHRFIHALHHDVVYDQVPAARRRRLHARLGDALEAAAGVHVSEVAPDLARHFANAGEHDRAVAHLVTSATRALRRYAGAEAASYLEEALGVLEMLPDGYDRVRQEIEVRSHLSLALTTTREYLSAEVVANYERVLALQRAAADSRHVFETAYALFLVVLHRADRDATEQIVAQLESMATGLDAADRMPRVTLARGLLELFAGRLAPAEGAFSRLDVPATAESGDFGATYGVDPITFGLVHRGIGDWLRGHPDRARTRMRDGLARAERVQSPLALGGALCLGAYIAGLRGDAGDAAGLAERATRLAGERDLGFYQPLVTYIRGIALAEQGRASDALPLLEDGAGGWKAMGSRISGSLQVSYLADVHVRAGQWDAGLAHVDRGLADCEAFLDSSHVAEVWRLRGELLLGKMRAVRGRIRARTSTAAAEECFRRSLAIAETQGARMLALRAATSLVRLHAAQRRDDVEARTVLARLYDEFDEGFDGKDLVEARRILQRPDARRPLAS